MVKYLGTWAQEPACLGLNLISIAYLVQISLLEPQFSYLQNKNNSSTQLSNFLIIK